MEIARLREHILFSTCQAKYRGSNTCAPSRGQKVTIKSTSFAERVPNSSR